MAARAGFRSLARPISPARRSSPSLSIRATENAIAATTCGLYRRTLTAGSSYEWKQLQPGVHSSVVAASAGGMTRFLCARWGDDPVASGIFYSDDGGGTWQPAGTRFPAPPAGRIALRFA